jgi:hypothetical protein
MKPRTNIEDDYEWATVRLVVRRDDVRLRLVFATIELLPIEVPRQPTTHPDSVKIPKTERGYCYFRHVSMKTGAALAWYKNALAGCLRTPVDPDAPPIRGDNEPVETLSYGEEPPWPNLVVGGDLPFLADWQGVPRVHQLVPLAAPTPEITNLLADGRIGPWLQERLFFDLAAYPEWHGGIVLVAPNPLFRRVERRRLRADGALPERTLVRLHLRTGVSPNGLRLILWDERGDGIGDLSEVSFTAPWVCVEHPCPVEMEGLAIVSQERGLLHWEAPGSYVSRVIVRTAVPVANKQVLVPATPRRSEEQYNVTEVADHEVVLEPTGIGPRSADDRDIAMRLSETRRARRRRREAQQLDQKWFHGNQSEAAAFIRSLIGRAQKRVMIVDPYFAGRELIRFAHATTRPDVQIGILTSAKVLRETKDAFNPALEAGEGLFAASLNFNQQQQHGALEVRVMPGDIPSIHDRFLVVDDDAWLSGNSLNEIGERAGIILRLPDPLPVVAQLEGLFAAAELLKQWLEDRRKRQGDPAPGSNGGSGED